MPMLATYTPEPGVTSPLLWPRQLKITITLISIQASTT